MATLNKVLIIGNLTRDPEAKPIPGGAMVTSFSVAVNRKYKSQAGEQKEEVAFLDCEAWAKTGELAMQYLTKGKSVMVEGRLKQDRWETPEGQKRSKIKIVVDNIQFLGGKGEAQSQPEAQPTEANTDPDVPF